MTPEQIKNKLADAGIMLREATRQIVNNDGTGHAIAALVLAVNDLREVVSNLIENSTDTERKETQNDAS